MQVHDRPIIDKISIVVPLYNEDQSVVPLSSGIERTMRALKRDYEIIFIDDGSNDRTLEELLNVKSSSDYVVVIAFRRNFGQTAAISAGIDYASGSLIIPMDGDLQNDPADIPRLVREIEQGYDIVSGWRADRQDDFFSRKLPSRIANWLIGKITGVKLRDYGCTLKAYRSEVLKPIKLYGEMHRFIPALASWSGARIKEIPVNHRPRKYGISKYGIGRTLRVVLDMLTVKFMIGFVTRPLHMLGLWALLFISSGFGYGLYLTLTRLLFDAYIKPLRPLIVILLIISGIQLLTIGLLAEIVARTYFESQNKPIYAIKRVYK